MDRFDFMKRLQDRIDEVQAECREIEEKIRYHKARNAKALGISPSGEEEEPQRYALTRHVQAGRAITFWSDGTISPEPEDPKTSPTDENLEEAAMLLSECKTRLASLKKELAKAETENVVDKIKELMNE